MGFCAVSNTGSLPVEIGVVSGAFPAREHECRGGFGSDPGPSCSKRKRGCLDEQRRHRMASAFAGGDSPNLALSFTSPLKEAV